MLLIMSLLFYAWGEPVYVLLMIASILLNFLLGKGIGGNKNKEQRKALLIVAVIINLSSLAVFKYAGMLAEFINAIIPYNNNLLHVPKVRLPIGISFFTFQAMSYLFDVYKGEVPVQKKVLNLALYISFFPQLIAGPIVRYHDINEQLENRTIDKEGVYYGLKRFIIGLAKKVLIANVVAQAADEIFAMGANELSMPLAWLGIVCYTLQIYFDFSGYSDMAIGLGRIFGFKLLENFNFPYIAKNIQDFWRRWHISLSSWFRDYLYIPLGGNRKGKVRTYLNLVIVFFLCGLWHGASWTFVAWGLYHGLFLTIERLLSRKMKLHIPSFFQYTYTIFVVMIGWVLFRAENFSASLMYFKAMAGFGASENIAIWKYLENRKLISMLLVGIVASTPLINKLIRGLKQQKLPGVAIPYRWAKAFQYLVISGLVLFVTSFVTYPYKTEKEEANETKFEIISNSPRYQLFYTFGNSNFNEKQSKKFNGMSVEIPDIGIINALRLDAIMQKGDIWRIESIKISNDKVDLSIQGSDLFNAIGQRSLHLGQPMLKNNVIEMEVLGHDPYFTLALDLPLTKFDEKNIFAKVNRVGYVQQWKYSLIFLGVLILSALVYLFTILWKQKDKKSLQIPFWPMFFRVIYICFMSALVVYVVASLAVNTYNPFIYFRF